MAVSLKAPDQHGFGEFDGEPVGEYLSDIIRLPGYWEAREECEQIKPTGFCEHGHVQFGAVEPCSTRTCPIHWPRWLRRAVANVVARLAGFRAAQGGPSSSGRRMLHVVAAPPQDRRWTVDAFWKARSASYEPLAEVGAVGGVAIPHPYRTNEAGDELYRWVGRPEVGEKKWSALRGFTDDWGELSQFIAVEPHVHGVVAARDFDGDRAKEIEAERGWVVENIRSLDRFYVDGGEVLPVMSRADRAATRGEAGSQREALEAAAREKALAGYEDMARLVWYQLTHGAVQPETGELPMRQTVTYWGAVHSFKPEEELDPETWRTIKAFAWKAVGLEPPEDSEFEPEPRDCKRDGCEAVVYPVTDLQDRLAAIPHEWFDGLEREQQLEMLGLDEWGARKPPPGAESEEEFIDWLRTLGRRRVERCEVPFLTVGMSAA